MSCIGFRSPQQRVLLRASTRDDVPSSVASPDVRCRHDSRRWTGSTPRDYRRPDLVGARCSSTGTVAAVAVRDVAMPTTFVATMMAIPATSWASRD